MKSLKAPLDDSEIREAVAVVRRDGGLADLGIV